MKPEKMSRLAMWVFGLPIAYIIYLTLSLVLPNINNLTTAFHNLVLIVCILLTGKFFLKFRPLKFFTDSDSLSPRKFFTGFFAMLVMSITTTLVWFLFEKENFSYSFRGLKSVENWLTDLPLLITAVITEELIFRSYFAHILKDSFEQTNKASLIYAFCTAILFTIAHFENPETNGSVAIWAMLFYFIFGFGLSLITFKTKSIETAMGIHFANNIFCTVFVGYEDSVIKTSAIFTQTNNIGPVLLVQSVFCLLACMFICNRQK